MVNELNFFTDNSPFLAHPLLTAARTGQEIDFIVSVLGLSEGARILDVGCGFGRHTVELARRGFDGLGIDPSAAMIAAAQQRARETAVSATFQQAYAEDFVAKRPFDGAICLFTSLGQVSDRGENRGLVRRIYDALQPGGRFVVEVPQRETAVRNLKPSDTFGEGDRYTAVTRSHDPQTHFVTEHFNVVTPAQTTLFTLQYRLYDQNELRLLLHQAGFTVQAAYGSYAGQPLTADHPIMIFVAQK